MTGPGTPGKVGLAGQARQEHTKPNRGRAHFNQPNLVRAQPQNRAVERAGAYSTWSRRSSRFRSSSDRVTARQRGEAAREGVVAQPRRRVRLTPPQQRRRHTRAQSALARRCRIRSSRRGRSIPAQKSPPPLPNSLFIPTVHLALQPAHPVPLPLFFAKPTTGSGSLSPCLTRLRPRARLALALPTAPAAPPPRRRG